MATWSSDRVSVADNAVVKISILHIFSIYKYFCFSVRKGRKDRRRQLNSNYCDIKNNTLGNPSIKRETSRMPGRVCCSTGQQHGGEEERMCLKRGDPEQECCIFMNFMLLVYMYYIC